jgi:translation initiation factor 2B subunit (eIF-2B alpha/beta/delta family)
MSGDIMMNSIVTMIGISVVLISGFIFIIPLSNTDKVFAGTAAIGNNESAASKANTTTTASAVHRHYHPTLTRISVGPWEPSQAYKIMKLANRRGSFPVYGD